MSEPKMDWQESIVFGMVALLIGIVITVIVNMCYQALLTFAFDAYGADKTHLLTIRALVLVYVASQVGSALFTALMPGKK